MGHLGWLLKLHCHPRHQYCIDKVQRTEIVLILQLIIYVCIDTYILSQSIKLMSSSALKVLDERTITVKIINFWNWISSNTFISYSELDLLFMKQSPGNW